MQASDDHRHFVVNGRRWLITMADVRDIEIEVAFAETGGEPQVIEGSAADHGYEALWSTTVPMRRLGFTFENGWKVGIDWSKMADCCDPDHQDLEHPELDQPHDVEVVIFDPDDNQVRDSDGNPAHFPHMTEQALGGLLEEMATMPTVAKITIDRTPERDHDGESAFTLNVGIPAGMPIPERKVIPGWNEVHDDPDR